ncbi:uncharacterized protein LOC110045420 isoform X2 [Orbicella faveolata]|uniref:uncharacterized protein LOC110045420 isoform X2 n=1 Tax=Orbicella faveolata TaxID=48498 RepID=UPI0009E3BDB5|nr:uncharacterized protein LOC110045420 isoform X2 [Orbicella faveolata]
MGHNRRFLKAISIVQVVISAIFFALGIVDRYEVRFIYTSFLFTPCWIAALVLPAGIMGVILVNKSSPSSTLINAVSSVSMTSVIVSGITVYQYKWAVGRILIANLYSAGMYREVTDFANKDVPLKLTDQEKTVVAISSLIAIFSTIEVALGLCAAWISDSLYQPPQENQISQARNVNNQFGAGQIPMHPPYTAAQPMVAVPVPSYNALK